MASQPPRPVRSTGPNAGQGQRGQIPALRVPVEPARMEGRTLGVPIFADHSDEQALTIDPRQYFW
ncbi:MAG: hypothetical protein IT369_01530 [Candidatus Latescibacteria bacterium]|nr:hypothetical protein [Candidatus Latescibacterota bacterium]